MTEIPFEMRLQATGLRPTVEDLPKLRAIVADLDRAAALMRAPLAYADEPSSAFRLHAA